MGAAPLLIGSPGYMPFDRTFFRNIGSFIEDYKKVYPCAAVTLTLRVMGEEYHVGRIMKADEMLLTFSYYSDSEKTQPLTAECVARTGETTAWPALTVPYQAVLSVELNPGKAAHDRDIGFRVPTNL